MEPPRATCAGPPDPWLRLPTAVAAHVFSFLDMAPHLLLARCSRTLATASHSSAWALAPEMTLVVSYPVPERTVLRLLPSRHLTLRTKYLALGPRDALRQVAIALRKREARAESGAQSATEPQAPEPRLFSRLTISGFSLGGMTLLATHCHADCALLPPHVTALAVQCERARTREFSERAGRAAWQCIAGSGGLHAVSYPHLPWSDWHLRDLEFRAPLTALEIGSVEALDADGCVALASVTDLSVERFEHSVCLYLALRRMPLLTRLAVRNVGASTLSGVESVGSVAAKTLRTLEFGHYAPAIAHGDAGRVSVRVAHRAARGLSEFIAAFSALRRLSLTEDVTSAQLAAAVGVSAQTCADRGSAHWRQDVDPNVFAVATVRGTDAAEDDEALVAVLPRHDWSVLEKLPHLETLELGYSHIGPTGASSSSSSASSTPSSLTMSAPQPSLAGLIPLKLPRLASLREFRLPDNAWVSRDANGPVRLRSACFPALERLYVGGVARSFTLSP